MYDHAASRNEQKRGRGPSWPTHFWWPDGGRPTIPSRFGQERQMLASLDRYVKDSTDSFTARFAGHACATLWVRGPFPAPPRLTLTARSSCSCRGLEA